VLAAIDPNLVLPVTKSTDEVIVCTTNVCAIILPATVKLLPLTVKALLPLIEDVVLKNAT
jgi:hypothetical protein